MKTKRRYDIDWLRSITVLTIILYHTCEIFITNSSAIMFIKSNTNLNFCVIIQMFFSRWHMVLLFFISGISCFFALNSKNMKLFLQTRINKILIPFILGCVFLNPTVSYIYGLSIGRNISYITHIKLFFTTLSQKSEGTTPGFSPMHLWFLLYLFLYILLCLPIFNLTNKYLKVHTPNKINSFFTKHYTLLLLTLPYPFIFWIFNVLGERNPIGYLYIFIIGYLFATNEKFQTTLDKDKWGYLILSIIFMSLFYHWNYVGNLNTVNEIWTLKSFITKISKITFCYTLLAFAHSFIPNKKTELLNFLSKSAFPIYIYHMLIVTIIGYFILTINLNSTLQFLLINIITYTISFAFYKIFNILTKIYHKKLFVEHLF